VITDKQQTNTPRSRERREPPAIHSQGGISVIISWLGALIAADCAGHPFNQRRSQTTRKANFYWNIADSSVHCNPYEKKFVN